MLYGLIKKDPLIPALIKGTKPEEVYEDNSTGNQSPPQPMLRAGICFALAALVVFGPIIAVGGRL